MAEQYALKIVVLSPASVFFAEQIDFGISKNNITYGVGSHLVNTYMLEQKRCSEHYSWICGSENEQTRYEMYWGHVEINELNPTALKLIPTSKSVSKTCKGNCYIVKSTYEKSIDSRVYVDTNVNEFVKCFNEHNRLQFVKNTNGVYQLKSIECCGIL